jgi:hypothetical protein
MWWKKYLLSVANAPLFLVGARLVPHRDHLELSRLRSDMAKPLTFRLGEVDFQQFAHFYNCGWPYLATATERSVELALADRWLDLVDNERVLEVGAVSPYYWPKRVMNVLDPTDAHPNVTVKKSLFDVDLTGKSVLSISTFEHIGIGDYGLSTDEAASARALDKLFKESPCFLATFAAGYNLWLDQHLITERKLPSDVDLRLLVRDHSGIGWHEKELSADSLRPYGSSGGNALFIIHRGTGLFGANT